MKIKIFLWKKLRALFGEDFAAFLMGFYYAEYPIENPQVWEITKKKVH